MSSFQFEQIGVIRSPYKEKFAVPRQPGLVKSANGELHLLAPYNQTDAVRGLEAFSHLWVIFVFHQTMEGGWRPTVRPPRLGGNARMGVFATRSTFRPNPVGMSLVELRGIRCRGGHFDGAKRAGEHTVFTADALRLSELNTVIRQIERLRRT